MIATFAFPGKNVIEIWPVQSKHIPLHNMVICEATERYQRAWLWLLEIVLRKFTEGGRHMYIVALYKSEEDKVILLYADSDKSMAMSTFDEQPMTDTWETYLLGTDGSFEVRSGRIEALVNAIKSRSTP